MSNRATVLHTDYKRFLKHTCNTAFNIVFIDPPYNTGLSDKALTYISDGMLLHPGAVVVLECDNMENKPEKIGMLRLRKRYIHSGVSFLVYVKEDDYV